MRLANAHAFIHEDAIERRLDEDSPRPAALSHAHK